MLCLKCGKFGHYKDGCQLKVIDNGAAPNNEKGVVMRNTKDIKADTYLSVNDNGPWKVVQK